MGLAIVGLVFAVLSSATVTGRILSRFTAKRILGKDDYLMVASLVSHPTIFSPIRNLRFRVACANNYSQVCAIAFTIVTTMGMMIFHSGGQRFSHTRQADCRAGVSYGYGRPSKSLSKEQLQSALKV